MSRQPDPLPVRRRTLWWIASLALILVLAGAALVWLFRPRLERAFERPPTLPPPPPTSSGGSAGGVENLLYATDFDDPQQTADWELYNDGIIAAQIADGMLVVSVNALEDKGAWSGLNYTFEDFVLEVDARKLAGPDNNGIVVIFRLTDAANYNRFEISSDGYYRLSMVRGGVSRIVSDYNSSSAILTGESTNHITLRAVGDAFTFAVNGQPLALCVSADPAVQPLWDIASGACLGGEVTDVWRNADLPRGRVGLGVQGFAVFDGENLTPAQATVGFDNVVITRP